MNRPPFTSLAAFTTATAAIAATPRRRPAAASPGLAAALGPLLLTLLALLAGCASLPPAQSAPPAPEAQACALPDEQAGPESARLYGAWTVRIDGQPAGRLQLRRHPEYPDSVSGSYTREGEPGTGAQVQVARVAGDMDQGLFTLEESADGQTTSGRWSGQWSPTDCGNEIRGDWIDARQEQALLSGGGQPRPARHAFVMRRASAAPAAPSAAPPATAWQ